MVPLTIGCSYLESRHEGTTGLAVQFLRKASIPILGGDVYLKRGAKIELAYADWHSDPHRGEDLDRYLERSWAGTANYIRSFSQPPDAMPLFSLVVGGG